MATSKEDVTAVAAEQLGSMSLGESAERKDEPSNGDAEDGTPTNKKYCSWCSKENDTAKKCTACKCVWYCDKECQNKHWKEHKKECKRVKKELDKRGGKLDLGTEEDVGPLGKVPPREECPICMRVLPIHTMLQHYFSCCGKSLCRACEFQHKMKSGGRATCAFCREPIAMSEKERLARLSKRVTLNDPVALCNMGMHYCNGNLGLPVDQTKGIDLLRQSADLGCPEAHYQLGNCHHGGKMGLEENEEEALKYWRKGAENGDLVSRHNFGLKEGGNGNEVAAMRHLRLSASGGYRLSIEQLIMCFEGGLLHHADLAETMQAYYLARDEMRSGDRKQYIEHLKKTGKYEAEFDW